jgi:sulfite reductase alpha subunit-like flavoprotein
MRDERAEDHDPRDAQQLIRASREMAAAAAGAVRVRDARDDVRCGEGVDAAEEERGADGRGLAHFDLDLVRQAVRDELADGVGIGLYRRLRPEGTATLEPVTGQWCVRQIVDGALKLAECDSQAFRALLATGAYQEYDFLAPMVCPGGCVFGGGQPRMRDRAPAAARIRALRSMAEEAPQTVPPFDFSRISVTATVEPFAVVARKTKVVPPVLAWADPDVDGQSYGMRFARLSCAYLKAPSQHLNDVNVSDLAKRRQVVLIVFGETMPLGGQAFWSRFEKASLDLSELQVAAFGEGAAKLVLDAFVSKGATAALPFAEGATIEKFHEFSKAVAVRFALTEPKFLKRQVANATMSKDSSIASGPSRPVGFDFAEKVDSSLMSQPDEMPQYWHHVLKLPEGMNYYAGDHILILPKNPEDRVNAVIEALKLDGGNVFDLEDSKPDSLIPRRVSIRQLLEQYLDLNGAPTQALLKIFYESSNAEGKAKLGKLIDAGEGTALTEYLKDTNIFETLVNFAQFGVPEFTDLILSWPRIMPRIYSIASAPEARRGYLELMVLGAHFGPEKHRYGFCTNFLSRPETVKMSVKCMPGVWRYPQDRKTPLIMVGVGGGIACMFSLLGVRAAELDKCGPALVFFQARNRSAYPLLMKKMDGFERDKLVDGCYRAFSRDPPKPVHVQELLREHAAEVWNIWQDHRAQLYFAGPARGIIDDIREILVDIIVNEGWMAREEAMAINSRHEVHVESYVSE